MVWNMILGRVFPESENFAVGPEMSLGGGRADLFAAHHVFEPKAREAKFFIVECKAPGKESQTGIWNEAWDQLITYLSGIHPKHAGRRYGAIAVGKGVRFYEWISNPGTLRDLSLTGSQEMLYLDRQCRTVTDHLMHIRQSI